MNVKIQKWGNSLGLRIPRAFAIDSHIQDGSIVELTLLDGKLIVAPLEQNKYELSDLLEQIDSSNMHSEIETGKPVGSEIW